MKGLEDLPLNAKEKERCKNFFALGLVSWIYTRPLDPTLDAIKKRFAKNPTYVEANIRVLKAGHAFGETAEMFAEHYGVEPAEMAPGTYRSMTGNRALAWGLLAAAQRTQIPIVFGAYPITPASSILEELALHKRFRVRTFQAEDEIAAATAAIGASFGGAIGVTASSGPGIALKGEAIGLAVTAELPLVIFDIQRGGPEHRAADQDRAGRPDAGAVRPQQRVADRGASRRRRRATASSSPTRRCGSRSSTWCR